MTFTFDVIQTAGIAGLVFLLGTFIKNRNDFFKKFFIPAPVIGGLICSFLIFFVSFSGITIKFDKSLQNFFMDIFFTCIGFTCSFSILKKSGKRGAVLAVVAVGFLILQNLVGVTLAGLFGLNKLLGIAMGSISMSGGVGSAASFGPSLEQLGANDATTIGVAAATFGLLLGSIIGGPVAKRLILKNSLKSNFSENKTEEKVSHELDINQIVFTTILILIAAFLGTYIHKLLLLTTLNFPYYVGNLFGGLVVRNIYDHSKYNLRTEEVKLVSTISLDLFLSMALMTLNISALVSLAIPMIVILLSQALIMILYAYFVTFKTMGKDYDAAVMAAGHCGVGLGQTPNAIANMSSIIEENGPAPEAWFTLPVVTVIFINIFNPVIITFFMTIFS
jgi:ESS family glutamate:Na+ symporter